MARPTKVLISSLALVGVTLVTAACGTQRISVPKSPADVYSGAVLFSQRCSGCHTLSYAGTHGSAENVRDRAQINGPNFNVRCERPITRVLYAIEDGGFSGAYMPANIVVGKQARDVAEFVSEYAGRKAVYQATPGGQKPCQLRSIGTLPPSGAGANVSLAAAGVSTTATGTSTTDTGSATTATTGVGTSTTASSATASSTTQGSAAQASTNGTATVATGSSTTGTASGTATSTTPVGTVPTASGVVTATAPAVNQAPPAAKKTKQKPAAKKPAKKK